MSFIRDHIRDARLRPGDVLASETAMAARLGVSRSAAREAFRGLATLGVLRIGAGRRARVAAPDASALGAIIDHTVYTGQMSVQQVLDVRRTLGRRTAASAALRRSAAEARALQAIAEAMMTQIEAPDAIMELDIRFHDMIAQASGKPLHAIIVGAFATITRQTWAIGWRSRATRDSRIENIRLHQRIAAAIAAQDPVASEAAIVEHFDGAVATLLHEA